MAEARGRGEQRRPQADGPMFGSVVLSSVLHGLVIGLLILAPHRMRSAPPTAYTVELVDPGALGGKLLAGPIGGQESRASRQKAPPPEPPPPRKPEPPPPEPATKEPERLAQAEAPPEDDAEAIPIATAEPTPVLRSTPVERPTVRPTVQLTRKPTPRPTPTVALAQRAKPTATLAAAVAKAGAPTPVASPKRLAGVDAGAEEPRAAKPTPQGGPRKEVDDQLAAAIKGLEAKTKAGGTGVGAPGPGGGMGGTEQTLTGPAGVGGEGPGGGGTLRGLEFVVYYNQMLTRIKDNWAWVGERKDLRVTVRFSILPSGEIVDLRLVERSGDSGYDASVERAVKRSSPLGPPPQAYRSDFADVELAFRPADLQAAPR